MRTTKTLFRETRHYSTIGDWSYWRGWVVGVFIVGLSALVFMGIFVFAFWVASISCEQFGEQTALETEYRIPSGCYISIEGDWIPASAYRATDEVNR